VRHRGLLHVVPRGQRSEDAAGGGAVAGVAAAAAAAATDVRAALHVGAHPVQFPAVVVGRERVRRLRPRQHVDHGQLGRHRVHVAAGVAAERAGTERQQAVGGRVRGRLAAGPRPARQPQRRGGGGGGGGRVRPVQDGAVPADQGERDAVQAGGPDGGRAAQDVGGAVRRLAGQRAQHVQLAGGLQHQPVGGPGDVRVLGPGGRGPGGAAAGQDHHKHQPHTVHVRHHAAHQRRRGALRPEDAARV